jgi:hypothetical protein
MPSYEIDASILTGLATAVPAVRELLLSGETVELNR